MFNNLEVEYAITDTWEHKIFKPSDIVVRHTIQNGSIPNYIF